MAIKSTLVTVFGGSGFIGRYIVRRLAAQGYRVRVAIRRPDEGLFLKTMGAVGQIELMQANLRVPASVARAVAGAEAVVNCVGILQPSGPQTFQAVQAFGAEVVAKLSADAGVKRLVHISAIGADAASASQYARTKAAGEAAVRQHFPQAVILRPSVVFGPEDDFFNRFAAMAAFSPALPLVDGGHTRFQPVYVDDVAEAAVKALFLPDAAGKTFELGGPRIYSFREILELLLATIQRRRLLAPVPGALLRPFAFVLEMLPLPFAAPITRDQITLLGADNVVSPEAFGFARLGITPRPAEGLIESYLMRHRRGGGKFTPRFS